MILLSRIWTDRREGFTVSMDYKKGLSAYELKVIAIVAMTVDHIAWMWVPTASLLGQCMHIIGRITAPVMCYLLVEGYIHTHNIRRYTLRLGIFAVISAFPFYFFERCAGMNTGSIPSLGMIYTLFLALIVLRVYDSRRLHGWKKSAVIFVLFLLSFMGDWAGIGVIWPLVMYIYKDDKKAQLRLLSYTALLFASLLALDGTVGNMSYPYIAVFQFGMLLAVPVIASYNGRLGGKRCGKWFFYVYYPAHLIIIALLKLG